MAAGLVVRVMLDRLMIVPTVITHQWCVCGAIVHLVLDCLKFLHDGV